MERAQAWLTSARQDDDELNASEPPLRRWPKPMDVVNGPALYRARKEIAPDDLGLTASLALVGSRVPEPLSIYPKAPVPHFDRPDDNSEEPSIPSELGLLGKETAAQ